MSSLVVQKAGPYGSQRQGYPQQYYDDQHTGIRQIKLVYSDTINSMTTEYDSNGVSVWGTERGMGYIDGVETVSINFSPEDEYLISVSGFYGNWESYVVIFSLTFQTNKRVLGPFGTQSGTKFSFPPSNGKIVGFFGTSGQRLDSIGAYWVAVPLPIYPSPWPYKDEPYGGKSGSLWDDGVHTLVQKIKIWYGDVINAISFEYDNKGNTVLSQLHGNPNPTGKSYTVVLGYPDEYLVSVSGYIRNESSTPNVIESLTFVSNKKSYGPVGGEISQKSFVFSSAEGKIIGFYGTADSSALVSLGLYREIPNFETVGPFGGPGGCPWSDATHANIRKIDISVDDFVQSVRFEYVNTLGDSVWSDKHGASSAGDITEIQINDSTEYLTSIEGFYDTLVGFTTPVIVSLTFKTNLNKTHGPYGLQEGTAFKIGDGDGKIIGFLGQSGDYIDSIGACIMPISNK